jgi:hypothetical protein
MVHGRASARASHWWYIARGTRTVRRRDPSGATLIETRSTRGQTVAPPSLHEDTGELIEWERNGEPAAVDAPALALARDRIAAVAMLARRWSEGSRHDAALALAGLLLRGGMGQGDAERLVEVVARVAGDHELRDRVRAVSDTAAALAAGGRATGAPRLAELLPDGEAVVAKLREWLGLRESVATAGDDIPPVDLWGAADLTGQPDLDLAHVPPIIADMAADEAERLGVDPAMLAIPALVVCAAALDDGHRLQPRRHDTRWTESARLWAAVVALPGGRKTPALGRAVAPLRSLEQEWHTADHAAQTRYDIELRRYRRAVEDYVRRGVGAVPDEPARPRMRRRVVSDATTEALADILADVRTAVLATYDELSAWIASHDAYRERAGRDRALWLSLYDGGPQVVDRVRRGHVAVPRWSACVLGGTQPGPLRRLIGRCPRARRRPLARLGFGQRGCGWQR